MTIQRYSVQIQAVYSELVELLQIAEIEGLMEQEGSFVKRTIKGNPYWYLRRRIGNRIHERYIGPETIELLAQMKKLKTQAMEAKNAAKRRRALIRQLRSEGYLITDRRIGRVLEELALAGVFRLNGTLVGTHAFRCYSALLGVRLEQQLALTSDVDIAQDTSVSLGITDTADPQLGEALAKAEKFIEIPTLDPKSPPTSWRTTDQELRVDVLAPLVGKSRRVALELPSLGAHAKPLRFLDFLLADTIRAAVLTGSGILVRVPTPERYALHKLIIAQRRNTTARDKAQKDLAQAQTLLGVLLEDRPDDVKDAWADLVDRGRKWKSEATKSVRRLPKPMQEPFR